MEFFIKDEAKIGMSRAELEENLRKEGKKTMSDAQLEKTKWVEKKFKEEYGHKNILLDMDIINKLGK